MSPIITAIISLGAIGLISSLILYFVSKRFHVEEDPRIELIEQLLPGANCGGCGRSGCHDFATACASASSLDSLICPGAGSEAMKKIAEIVGLAAVTSKPQVAVVRCNGSCENRPTTSIYNGPESCAIMASLGVGTSSCAYGCLGCGDCVATCRFGAITIDNATHLPVVNEELCTGCGCCVSVCPRHIIELRNKGTRGLRVWVACANKERGAIARKACSVACIGCGKCHKVCTHDAITIADNLAYIDAEKCKLCHKCVGECPTTAIHSTRPHTTTQPS